MYGRHIFNLTLTFGPRSKLTSQLDSPIYYWINTFRMPIRIYIQCHEERIDRLFIFDLRERWCGTDRVVEGDAVLLEVRNGHIVSPRCWVAWSSKKHCTQPDLATEIHRVRGDLSTLSHHHPLFLSPLHLTHIYISYKRVARSISDWCICKVLFSICSLYGLSYDYDNEY